MTDNVAVAEPADQENADVMDMLDHIAQANYEKANAIFNDQINDRIHDALEQEKVGVAHTITLDDLEITDQDLEDQNEDDEQENGAEDAVLDDEITDEDLEAAVDELIDDEDED
tara:strand:+ start:3609 stop:3950 length:342 start_codon:yes stop_codon:yes gene_type:complete